MASTPWFYYIGRGKVPQDDRLHYESRNLHIESKSKEYLHIDIFILLYNPLLFSPPLWPWPIRLYSKKEFIVLFLPFIC